MRVEAQSGHWTSPSLHLALLFISLLAFEAGSHCVALVGLKLPL